MRFFTSKFCSWIDWISDSHLKLLSYGDDSRKNRGRKSHATVPFKILWITKKTPGGKKIYITSSYSTAKNMIKNAEVKLSSCGLQKKLQLWNSGCGATSLLKVAKLRLQKCFLQIAELQLRTKKKSIKKFARAHLWLTYKVSGGCRPCFVRALFAHRCKHVFLPNFWN